jgi:glucose/arabinose dehydrogenase
MRATPIVFLLAASATGAVAAGVLTGAAAWGDWTSDAPGVTRKITLDTLPEPTKPSVGLPAVVTKPADAKLSVPAGFTVTAFAKLDAPRQLRTAPNGDVFAAETAAGRLKLIRTTDGAAQPAMVATFAEGLDRPFGVAFWPPGPNPQWLYVANINSVVRFPYRNGDLKARGPAETIVPQITVGTGGHSTRDIAFSPDGKRLYLSVGSGSNVAEHMVKKPLADAKAWDAQHGLGATWGNETDRADVLVMDPMGQGRQVFASGIRNCVSLAVQPGTDTIWCATNERDLIGDNLPPDYVTRVKPHAFYGWPWYYLGAHEDPRRAGERPDLKDKVTTPDVLIQAHSAPLGMTFYTHAAGRRPSRPTTAATPSSACTARGTGRAAPATRSSVS